VKLTSLIHSAYIFSYQKYHYQKVGLIESRARQNILYFEIGYRREELVFINLGKEVMIEEAKLTLPC
jgi:hypothetical protein